MHPIRPLRLARLAACAALFAAAAPAQRPASVPFPMDVVRADLEARALELVPRNAELAALAGIERVRFTAVLLPDGSVVDLELERVELERLKLGIQVDGAPAPDALAGLDLSVWWGSVAGERATEAALSFSRFGCRGWIRRGGELWHLEAQAGEGGDWSRSRSRMSAEGAFAPGGRTAADFCASDALDLNRKVGPRAQQSGGSLASTTLYECKVSVETDWQLHQVFGNLNAMTSYVTTLLAWVSYRYEEQIQTVLTYPYLQFYTTSSDPWSTPDSGGNCIDMLFEFRGAWQNNIPAGGDIGHFLSGANLGCGVAWLPGLCNPPYNFSVSGNINGNVQFPVQQGGGNWDFMVIAHELGHNFNAPHTHDYCPPLDQCAPPGYFGQCQNQQVCTNQGTLMSYCHLCSGGLNNITTYFHPANVADMRAWVESTCLPAYCDDAVTYCTAKTNSQGCTPAIGSSGHATLSGLDDFHVTATDVLNNKNGLLFFGFFPASQPFQGGTLCIGPPLRRTAVQNSAGNAPPNDCSGTFAFHWSHAYFAAQGIGGGTTVYAQYWYRDPQSSNGSGLTDALEFRVCN